MKKTDYSKIADRYDKNTIRKYCESNKVLEEYIKKIVSEGALLSCVARKNE